VAVVVRIVNGRRSVLRSILSKVDGYQNGASQDGANAKELKAELEERQELAAQA
jgi:hypothetical protein